MPNLNLGETLFSSFYLHFSTLIVHLFLKKSILVIEFIFLIFQLMGFKYKIENHWLKQILIMKNVDLGKNELHSIKRA